MDHNYDRHLFHKPVKEKIVCNKIKLFNFFFVYILSIIYTIVGTSVKGKLSIPQGIAML